MGVSLFYLGSITGGLLLGWIADHHGRMPALILCNLVGCIGGIATVFAKSFWVFGICRFLVGFAYDNCYMMFYVIGKEITPHTKESRASICFFSFAALEYTGVRWRTFVANMSSGIFTTMAMSIIPWIALWSNSWKLFTLITAVPLGFVIVTPFILPESAR